MRLPISSLQILFLKWVTSIEHYWVTLRKRRGPGSSTHRTAVCGPACTVVWQGRAGDRSPYAD